MIYESIIVDSILLSKLTISKEKIRINIYPLVYGG